MYLKLNIQRFADGKVVIETDLNDKGFKSGLDKMQNIAKTGFKAPDRFLTKSQVPPFPSPSFINEVFYKSTPEANLHHLTIHYPLLSSVHHNI